MKPQFLAWRGRKFLYFFMFMSNFQVGDKRDIRQCQGRHQQIYQKLFSNRYLAGNGCKDWHFFYTYIRFILSIQYVNHMKPLRFEIIIFIKIFLPVKTGKTPSNCSILTPLFNENTLNVHVILVISSNRYNQVTIWNNTTSGVYIWWGLKSTTLNYLVSRTFTYFLVLSKNPCWFARGF